MTKRLKVASRPEGPTAARAYVWARHGRTTYLVDARRVARALTALPASLRGRLIARLRANTSMAALS